MRKTGLILILGLILAGCGVISPKAETSQPPTELSLEKYDFDNLRKRGGVASELDILGSIKPVEDRRKNMKLKYDNKFTTREIRFMSNGKKISGMINYYPERSSLSPVIIMIRGYAEKAGYYPGSGTWRVADRLADAGLTTISLDFLGYGNSEEESTDMLEARFEKVESVMDLIATIRALPWVDKGKIGIWAHSNGGQIALSVLETTGKKYPTVLWAPMTQKFPESVLSTIDEDSPVKEVMANFEKHYDARRYAFENYYEWIEAPILIQQGTMDEWCKVEWQQEVINRLGDLKKEGELLIYGGDDHNLSKNWEEAVVRDVLYFGNKLSI